MRNFDNKRQNNWSGALPAIAAAKNGAPHWALGISPYQALSGGLWKIIFNPVRRSTSKIRAVHEILNNDQATRMEVNMARKHATFHQTVQADKRRKPLRQPFPNGSRVLVRGRSYTSSPGRSKKLEPHWFGPVTIAGLDPDTNKHKLTLPWPMDCQRRFFHVSKQNEYHENIPHRLASRRMDKPAPILIDNAEE